MRSSKSGLMFAKIRRVSVVLLAPGVGFEPTPPVRGRA